MAEPNDAKRVNAARLRKEAAVLLSAAARDPLRAEAYRKRATRLTRWPRASSAVSATTREHRQCGNNPRYGQRGPREEILWVAALVC